MSAKCLRSTSPLYILQIKKHTATFDENKARAKLLRLHEKCPNTGKYGPEKTPYLDTFHAVFETCSETFKNLFIELQY